MFHSNDEVLECLRHDDEIVTPERTWEFRALDIADNRGMSTKLDRQIWLDWHDVLAEPEHARMHMYMAEPRNVSLGVKRMRMETWQAAIVLFDSMMVNVKPPLKGKDIVRLLEKKQLPRPLDVVLPTANPSLIKLLDSLGIGKEQELPNGHLAEWEYLVELAKQGALLRPKRYLKEHGLPSNEE